MNPTYFAIAGLLFLSQCTTTDEGKKTQSVSQQEATPSVEEPSMAAMVDARTQYDLAAEIRLAERHNDEDERAFEFATLTESWQGQRFRWTTYYLSAFCPNGEGCHVVPFDRGGEDKDIVQGWSPQIELTGQQWKKLSEGCSKAEGQCQVTFEATLSTFRISTEQLTRLTFADVILVAVGNDVNL